MIELTELNPKWVMPENWALTDKPLIIGVSFICPHCGSRMAYCFNNPIDPYGLVGVMFDWPNIPAWWTRVSGTTFDDLTLAPSIRNPPHFHAVITNGQVFFV
jgi:hypothetical protein